MSYQTIPHHAMPYYSMPNHTIPNQAITILSSSPHVFSCQPGASNWDSAGTQEGEWCQGDISVDAEKKMPCPVSWRKVCQSKSAMKKTQVQKAENICVGLLFPLPPWIFPPQRWHLTQANNPETQWKHTCTEVTCRHKSFWLCSCHEAVESSSFTVSIQGKCSFRLTTPLLIITGRPTEQAWPRIHTQQLLTLTRQEWKPVPASCQPQTQIADGRTENPNSLSIMFLFQDYLHKPTSDDRFTSAMDRRDRLNYSKAS